MAKVFKEEKKKQISPINLKESQVEFLENEVKNRNEFFRWLLDGYWGYQKFMKEKNAPKI